MEEDGHPSGPHERDRQLSMTGSIGHIGSRDHLLGKNPSDSMIRAFSNEFYVTGIMPPAFITQAADDAVVKVANSIRFFESLHAKGVPAALHIYLSLFPAGQHSTG